MAEATHNDSSVPALNSPRPADSSPAGLDQPGLARTRSDEKSLESGGAAERPKGIRAWWSRRSRRARWAIVVGALLLVAGIVLAIVLPIVLIRKHNAPVGGAYSGDDTPGSSGKGSSSPPDGPASGYIPNNPPVQPANSNATVSGRRGGKYGYDSVVVLGASYCDNGHLRAKNYSASLTKPPYWGGRHSNGPVWVEYLTDVVGPNGTQCQLVDYAYAGAVVNNSQTPSAVPDLIGQQEAFLSDLVDGSVDDNTKYGKTLVAIWIGINSVTDVFLNSLKGTSNLQQGSAALVTDVTTIASVASTLANSTAFGQPPDLLLLPLPPFDELPSIAYLANTYGGNVSTARTFGDVFNDQLGLAITGLQSHLKQGQQVLTYDVDSWWKTIWSDPAAGGFQVSQQACLADGVVCQDPSVYFDWDSLHVTTVGHKQLATVLAQSIAQH